MQIFENLPPIVGLILGFVLLVWVVFVFLVPFMIESIRRSARETRDELAELNGKLDELTRYLTDLAQAANTGQSADAAGRAGPAREMGSEGSTDAARATDSARAGGSGLRANPPAKTPSRQAAKSGAGRSETRKRREPTISETDFQNEPRPTRREPRVK